MVPLAEQVEQIEQRRLDQARRQTPGAKMAAGLRLFAQVKRPMIAGIRERYPHADETQVKMELRRWLRLARENENLPWTR